MTEQTTENQPTAISNSTVYGNKALTLSEMKGVGTYFAGSGFFADASNVAKAFTKIAFGQELGIMPGAAMTGIHVIEGKPTVGGHVIAGQIKKSGKYTYKIAQQDADGCRIEFYEIDQKTGEKGFIGESSFMKDDAKDAGLEGKKNWRAYFRNMSFNRAISNGYKWYCPDVFSTIVYVPEEMGARVDQNGDFIDMQPEPPQKAEVVEEAGRVEQDEEGNKRVVEEPAEGEIVEEADPNEEMDAALKQAIDNDADPEPDTLGAEFDAAIAAAQQSEDDSESETISPEIIEATTEAIGVAPRDSEEIIRDIVTELRIKGIPERDYKNLIAYWGANEDPRKVEPAKLEAILRNVTIAEKKHIFQAVIDATKSRTAATK